MEITLNEHTVDEETELFQSGFLHIWREERGGNFFKLVLFWGILKFMQVSMILV